MVVANRSFLFCLITLVASDIYLVINNSELCNHFDIADIFFAIVLQLILLVMIWNIEFLKNSTTFFSDTPKGVFKVFCVALGIYLSSLGLFWQGRNGITVFGGTYYCNGEKVHSGIESLAKKDKETT